MATLIFLLLVVAVVAAVLGFGNMVAAISDIAIGVFWLFLLLLVATLLYRLDTR